MLVFFKKETYEHSQTIASQGRLGDSLSDSTCDYDCYGPLMVRVSIPSLLANVSLNPLIHIHLRNFDYLSCKK